MRTDDTRSLAAAQAVARAHGVACDDAVRIAGGSNALIHLRPAPVVARVMTATAILHDDLESWLTREVAVGRYLAERTAAVVAPSELLPPVRSAASATGSRTCVRNCRPRRTPTGSAAGSRR